jgi:hypothetical protein
MQHKPIIVTFTRKSVKQHIPTVIPSNSAKVATQEFQKSQWATRFKYLAKPIKGRWIALLPTFPQCLPTTLTKLQLKSFKAHRGAPQQANIELGLNTVLDVDTG